MYKYFFSVFLVSFLFVGCSTQTTKTSIPERYQDFSYCENNYDCKYLVFDGCCWRGVNQYNQKVDLLGDVKDTCLLSCGPKENFYTYCDESDKKCRVENEILNKKHKEDIQQDGIILDFQKNPKYCEIDTDCEDRTCICANKKSDKWGCTGLDLCDCPPWECECINNECKKKD